MDLNILGRCGGVPGPDRACSSFLLQNDEGSILFECGSGVHSKLNAAIYLDELKAIVISHLHPDHYNDLLSLYNQYIIELPGEKVDVYLPRTPENIYNFLVEVSSDVFNFIPIDESSKLTLLNGVEVTFCKTQHYIECYAMRIETGNEKEKLGYTADTGYFDGLIEFFKGIETLIAESTLVNDLPKSENHMTSREATILGVKCGAKNIILTHFWYNIPIDTYLKEAEEVESDDIIGYFEG